MKNKDLTALWQKYTEAESENAQMEIMKIFMLEATLEDLLAWNRFLAAKGEKTWAKHRKQGLTQEQKIWYQQQFEQFDDLEKKIRNS